MLDSHPSRCAQQWFGHVRVDAEELQGHRAVAIERGDEETHGMRRREEDGKVHHNAKSVM
jgi:hypothetical protein